MPTGSRIYLAAQFPCPSLSSYQKDGEQIFICSIRIVLKILYSGNLGRMGEKVQDKAYKIIKQLPGHNQSVVYMCVWRGRAEGVGVEVGVLAGRTNNQILKSHVISNNVKKNQSTL